MTHRLLVPTLLVLFGASSCSTARSATSPPAPAAPQPEAILLDDFEEDGRWTLESAGNHAIYHLVDEPVTSGAHALWVQFFDNGRDQASLRCEVDDDDSLAQALLLDLYQPGVEPVQVSIGLRAASGAVYTTATHTLQPGWNRSVSFALDATAMAKETDAKRWQADRARIDRLLINLRCDRPVAVATDPSTTNAGEHGGAPVATPMAVAAPSIVVIDRLQVVSTQPVRRDQPPQILATRIPAAAVGLRRPFTIEIDVRWAATPPPPGRSDKGIIWEPLPRFTALSARLRGPDGELRTIPGACIAQSGAGMTPIWTYRLAYAPELPGTYAYDLMLEGLPLGAGSFTCTGDNPGPGILRVDSQDPHWFSDPDGRFVWLVGQNVGWAGDYVPWIDALAAAKGNLLRTWTCPWNLPLAANARLGGIDLGNAAGIDRLLDAAAARGVRVQLCMFYHGWLKEDWGLCAWNRRNGGPIADPREFWTNATAKAWFRSYLTYAIARWGHHPGLFALELCNEPDLCPAFDKNDIVDWHRAMADHLAASDAHRHPVIASVAQAGNLPRLWRLENVAMAQPHAYQADPGQAVTRVTALTPVPAKPILLGEYGRGWMPPADQADPEGRVIHVAQWLSWIHGHAGNPWPWWWDTHIQPRGLERRLAAIAAFVADEDPRGIATRTMLADPRPGLALAARIAADQAWMYMWSPTWAAEPLRPWTATLVHADEQITIDGLAPGLWQVDWWDAQAGTILQRTDVAVTADGRATLAVPATTLPDLAAKMRRTGRLVPAVGMQP